VVSPFIALPNLLSGERVLPEFLAREGDEGEVANALLRLLPGGPDRDAALASLAKLRQRLAAPGVPDRAARWVLATAACPRAP
jgi:lipid A disaccharide synthetase